MAKPNIKPQKAPGSLVLCQKKPRRKIAATCGERKFEIACREDNTIKYCYRLTKAETNK